MRRIATLGVLIVALVMTASMAISTPARSDVRATAGNSRHGVEHITSDQSDWLGAINRYRSAASLPPVTDNSSWDAGIAAHLTYGNVKSIWPQRDHLIWPHLSRSMENLGSRNVQGCRPPGKILSKSP